MFNKSSVAPWSGNNFVTPDTVLSYPISLSLKLICSIIKAQNQNKLQKWVKIAESEIVCKHWIWPKFILRSPNYMHLSVAELGCLGNQQYASLITGSHVTQTWKWSRECSKQIISWLTGGHPQATYMSEIGKVNNISIVLVSNQVQNS